MARAEAERGGEPLVRSRTCLSLVEGTSEHPSAAIAAVATVGYTGFVWSPPLLGWIADTVDLRAAMGVIVFATLGITVMGFLARRTPPA